MLIGDPMLRPCHVSNRTAIGGCYGWLLWVVAMLIGLVLAIRCCAAHCSRLQVLASQPVFAGNLSFSPREQYTKADFRQLTAFARDRGMAHPSHDGTQRVTRPS